MPDRNPLDVEVIRQLTEENFLLTAELASVTTALGEAKLRIAYLERQGGAADQNKNMREFDQQMDAAHANARKGVFSS